MNPCLFDFARWYKGEVELEDQTDEVLQLTHLSREYHRFSVSCEATNAVGSTAQKYQFNIRCKYTIDALYRVYYNNYLLMYFTRQQ